MFYSAVLALQLKTKEHTQNINESTQNINDETTQNINESTHNINESTLHDRPQRQIRMTDQRNSVTLI